MAPVLYDISICDEPGGLDHYTHTMHINITIAIYWRVHSVYLFEVTRYITPCLIDLIVLNASTKINVNDLQSSLEAMTNAESKHYGLTLHTLKTWT